MENEEVTVIAEQPAVGETKVEPVADTEIQAKEEKKANLDKAIAEAQEELRRTREERKKAKQETPEEDVARIDDTDPGAKAWNKRINETIEPVSSQIEAQKKEVRSFALRRFLSDKPSLARNPEKLKELMSNYDRIKIATEQTQEGVLLDLDKAYAVTFHEELLSGSHEYRIGKAKEDMIASDIAIDRGSSSEPSQPPAKRQLSAEERKIVEQWETMGAPKID